MTAAVCVFGVDAMAPALISEWIESGSLPNLARLRGRSAWGTVLNPPRFFSGASWPNFYTGQVPARHDQYLRTIYDPNTCDHKPLRPSVDRVDAFWLSDDWRAKRTAVVNLPYCPIDARLNGPQIFDWYSHDRDHKGPEQVSDRRSAASPQPDMPPVSCYTVESTVAGFAEFRDRLLQRIRQKGDVARRVLTADDWELFVTGIDEAHCAGHQLWHVHDAAHPCHDPRAAGTLGDPIKDIYVEIDRAFGKIVEVLDADATILFVSSHGMGPAFDGNAILDEVLRRTDGLAPRAPGETQARMHRLAHWRRVFDALPRPAQSILAPLRRRFGRGMMSERRGAEARKRRCFWLPTHDLYGGIRINLAGREADGLVQPGREYETFVAQLIDDLHQLRDSRTGAPVVADVVRAGDVDPQGYAGERPDLVVRWRQASFAAIESPKTGRIESALVYGRTGDHPPDMEGVFFAAGAGVVPGRLPAAVRLEDFAPTISRWFGIDLPDTAGAVIANLCAEDGEGRLLPDRDRSQARPPRARMSH